MRIGENLMFAPMLSFQNVQFTSSEHVARAYEARVEGFYLQPAGTLCDSEHAFAAGVVTVSAIDFLASFNYTAPEMENRVNIGKCFKDFVQAHLPSFTQATYATRFYREFRNGLVHEARLKNAAEFNLNLDRVLQLRHGQLAINPRALIAEVRDALTEQVRKVREDRLVFQHLVRRIQSQFAKELSVVGRGRRAA